MSTELSNRERWLDHLAHNPLGRLYRLYRGIEDIGLDFKEFDLVQRPLTLHDVH